MALSDIQRLFQLTQKAERTIIGLMSGTSLDGLDVALCRISGSGKDTRVHLVEFETLPYTDDVKASIRQVFAQADARLEDVCLLHASLADVHAHLLLEALARWGIAPGEVDLLASHGQTIYHLPARNQDAPQGVNATFQIGDGDRLAVKTGIITLSDFRQKHVAAGGEGAPLAIYGDYLLFSSPSETRILLNIGGIANFTLLPGGEGTDGIVSTDTGPGNTLLDACVLRATGLPMDRDAVIASRGKVNETVLDALLDHPFFEQPLPKTTGQEVFRPDFVDLALDRAGATDISLADLLATLTRYTALTIAKAIHATPAKEGKVYVSGGGAHHPLLLSDLRELLPAFSFCPFAELGIAPDAKEAVLFAMLANEALAGEGIALPGAPGVTMGKISLPN